MIDIEEAIKDLERFANVVPPSMWQQENATVKQGFMMAIKVLRRMVTASIDGQDHKFLLAVVNWMKLQKGYRLINIRKCSECQKPHGNTHCTMAEADEVGHYWYLCPEKLQPGDYYLPDPKADS